MLKKVRRIFFFNLKLFITKLVNILLIRLNNTSIPNLNKNYISDLSWDHNSKSLLFKKNNDKFKIFRIDVTNAKTELCKIGAKFGTDKSPYNTQGARHSYTAIYDFLFSTLRNNKMNIGEIGIAKNSGIKTFREYFKFSKIYGFEFDQKLLKNAKKDNLAKTKYFHIDVSNKDNIFQTFKSTNQKFKIIIDDSTHMFDHQINIVKNVYSFIESGGYLIIEDVAYFRNLEIEYIKKIQKYLKYFSNIYFIEANHINKYTMHKEKITNDRLIVLIKK
tara:strand:+ start:79 stop:903 length:825 start_codon:yes stop_codon:yes gene_type:complete